MTHSAMIDACKRIECIFRLLSDCLSLENGALYARHHEREARSSKFHTSAKGRQVAG